MSSAPINFNKVVEGLFGVAVGDAIGVPFEFRSRQDMQAEPAKGMVGFGTHHQPAGTWSDDAALTFCLAESLANDYDLADIADRFVRWKNEAYWTARGEVFDIGITTSKAISRLQQLLTENDHQALRQQRYYGDEFENGNGSLMRILPLLFYVQGQPIGQQFEIIWEVSALTHRHIRAAMSCLIYLKFAEHLLNGLEKLVAYERTRQEISAFWEEMSFSENERQHFSKIIQNDIRQVGWDDLRSGGYVIEGLESSFWCFLLKENYEATILSIINLGHDTDTCAAIVGGLAGLYYGTANIPEDWLTSLSRFEDILALGNRLHEKYMG